MNNAELTDNVKNYARQQGARLVGVANTERLAEAPKGHHAEDFLPGARAVVVMGLPVLRAFTRGYSKWLRNSEKVPETLTRESTKPFAVQRGLTNVTETFYPQEAIASHIYRRCAYEFLNMELQRLSFYLALYLEESGYEAIYMPTTFGSTFSWVPGYPNPNWMAPFCTRHAAVAAGLGRFGLNNLFMTPQYGPRQRIVAVITTAELEPNPLMEDELCRGEECGICRKTCPNECFSDKAKEHDYGGGHVRMWDMDLNKCANLGGYRLLCVRQCWSNCPVGDK